MNSAASPRPRALDPVAIHRFVEDVIGDDLHAKRVLSLAHGVTGVLHAPALGIHALGEGLAVATGAEARHATKQIDRLLSNAGIDVPDLGAAWVAFVLADRTEAVVVLDWTDFEADDHTTLVASLVTTHGRASPLLWQTVQKSTLADARNDHEDALLRRLRDAIPRAVAVTIVADRGFADQKLYGFLRDLGFHFVIRFRSCIHVTAADGTTQPAADWVRPDGRLRTLQGARVTTDRAPVARVVLVHAPGMKEAWCLASDRDDLTGAQIKALYGRRFTIEETFRDTKDLRFGLGLSAVHIKRPDRRDRLLLLVALAQALLTLLGAAAEATGLDRTHKVNTRPGRSHSLFNQGWFWYRAIPAMKADRLQLLMTAFGEQLQRHRVLQTIFGVI